MIVNYNFICERCTPRLLKKGVETVCPLSSQVLKEMKKDYQNEHGHKHPIKTVLTTCLGHCPDQAVSYLEVRDNSLNEPKILSTGLKKGEIEEIFFKN
jgi:hypothetical protein